MTQWLVAEQLTPGEKILLNIGEEQELLLTYLWAIASTTGSSSAARLFIEEGGGLPRAVLYERGDGFSFNSESAYLQSSVILSFQGPAALKLSTTFSGKIKCTIGYELKG